MQIRTDPAEQAPSPPKLTLQRVGSVIWLLAWLTITFASCRALATSWPYVQHSLQIILVIAVAGTLFRAYDLWRMATRGQRMARGQRVLARVLCLFMGVVAGGALSAVMDELSMARFTRAFAPVVAKLHDDPAVLCRADGAHFPVDTNLDAFLQDVGAPRGLAEIRHGPGRFVLMLPGGSIDIDGSTIYYDSTTRGWRKEHNDMLAQSGVLDALGEGAERCSIALRP